MCVSHTRSEESQCTEERSLSGEDEQRRRIGDRLRRDILVAVEPNNLAGIEFVRRVVEREVETPLQ